MSIIPTAPTNANKANVVEVPSALICQGNRNCTRKLALLLNTVATPIAIPRIRLGNTSENNTHITGPSDTANDATNPRTPTSTNKAFTEIADAIMVDWLSLATCSPSASPMAVLKATSLSKRVPTSAPNGALVWHRARWRLWSHWLTYRLLARSRS